MANILKPIPILIIKKPIIDITDTDISIVTDMTNNQLLMPIPDTNSDTNLEKIPIY